MSVEDNGYPNGENGEVSARHDSTAEHSFDDVARGVATGTVPRRKALRVLVASLLGGAFVGTSGVAAAAPKPGGTGCSKPGQVRQGGQCVCASGLTTCTSGACIDPNTCGGGQTLNTTTCQCECASGRVFCGGRCITDPNCGADQILVADENGNCSCECRNENLEIIGGTCACPNPCGPTEIQNTTTCACDQCVTGFTRCGGNCVQNCPSDQILNSNCSCECRNVNQTLVGGQCVCTNTAFAANCRGSGGTFNDNTCRCDCPATNVPNNQGSCVCEANAATAACTGSGGTLNATCGCVCPNNKPLNPTTGRCECDTTTTSATNCTGSGGTLNATCGCTCPTNKPLNTTTDRCECNTTTTSATNCTGSGGTLNANCGCTCPANKPLLNASGQCVCDATTTFARNCTGSDGTLNANCGCTCPTNKPVVCPSGTKAGTCVSNINAC